MVVKTVQKVAGTHLLTTGEIAVICGVSPATVCKWIDRKELNGLRLPGSKDRRVYRHDLIQFMTKHEFPIDLLGFHGQSGILMIGLEQFLIDRIEQSIKDTSLCYCNHDLFTAGRVFERCYPGLVVIDCSVGRSAAIAIMQCLIKDKYRPQSIVLISDDETNVKELHEHGFDTCLSKPIDCDWLIEQMSHYLIRKDTRHSTRRKKKPKTDKKESGK